MTLNYLSKSYKCENGTTVTSRAITFFFPRGRPSLVLYLFAFTSEVFFLRFKIIKVHVLRYSDLISLEPMLPANGSRRWLRQGSKHPTVKGPSTVARCAAFG